MALLEKNTHIHATHEKRFSSMKKILILLFLFAPLFANAQDTYYYWYTAKSVKFDDGREPKFDFEEWTDCDIQVRRGDRTIKIFLDEPICLIGIEDQYKRTACEDGSIHMTKQCIDGHGNPCEVSFLHDRYDRFILLLLEYENYSVCYHVVPN